MTAFISPSIGDRAKVRTLAGAENFIEIYCACSLEVCEGRDVKGLYAKARQGLIKEFTGISSPYETPEAPELTLDTGTQPLDVCVDQVLALLRQRGIVGASR